MSTHDRRRPVLLAVLSAGLTASLAVGGTTGVAHAAPGHPSVAGPAAGTQAVSTAQAAKAPRLTLVRTSHRRLEQGRRATFTGTAPTSFVGTKVTLQRKVGGGRWKDVRTVKVTRKGTYAISGRTSGVGVNRWRTYGVTKVVKKRGKRVEKRKYSASTSLWSLGWFDLFDARNATRKEFNRYEAELGGRTYARSFGPRNGVTDGYVEFALAGRCDRFTVTLGQDDESLPDTRSQFLVTADGVTTDLGVRGRGKPRGFSLDVTGTSRLRLTSLRETVDGYYWGMWGNPKVLCHQQP